MVGRVGIRLSKVKVVYLYVILIAMIVYVRDTVILVTPVRLNPQLTAHTGKNEKVHSAHVTAMEFIGKKQFV